MPTLPIHKALLALQAIHYQYTAANAAITKKDVLTTIR